LEATELAGLNQNLAHYAAHYQDHPTDAADLITTGASPADPDLNPSEIATWTMVANLFLNLDETLTK
jgi:hypothetical protein